ncbi:hypothetical protein BKA62DRAFT_766006 [Auriculariales sp. MPI-PUGE-AT-0066]|nr:hypothetical protein BKA62DRAFT_766006 [Auriculariales sp. MPI-PUGE-AT-0066]
MFYSLRIRTPRWAGQFSTFLLLLNACMLTALIHYWTGMHLPSSLSLWDRAPSKFWRHHHHHHHHAAADKEHDDLHVAPPQAGRKDAPLDKSPAPALNAQNGSTLPGFCNVCGPEDTFCRKYGILGGSVTAGQGVAATEQWLRVYEAWWKSHFKGHVQVQNGAVPATDTGYVSMCFKEHIDEDVDLVITEFAINDHRLEENAQSYELLMRQLLGLPKRPAVLNLQVLGLSFTRLTTGGDLHTAIAEYYDTPVISLRNSLLPQLMKTNSSIETFFYKKPDGLVDTRHIGVRGHQMAGELLAAYTQRQICAMAQQQALAPEHLTGISEASQLALDLDDVPSHLLFSGFNDPPALVLDPYCSSTRTKKHPLVPDFNDGRWQNWAWMLGGGHKEKKYVLAKEPGAKIGFKVPVRGGGMGRIRIQYLRSAQFGLGILKCWLDDDTENVARADGYWKWSLNIAAYTVVSNNATKGDHMLWCEMTGHTNSPDGRTEFRFIGVDSV